MQAKNLREAAGARRKWVGAQERFEGPLFIPMGSVGISFTKVKFLWSFVIP